MSTESRIQLDDPKGYTKGLTLKQWQRSKWLKTFEQVIIIGNPQAKQVSCKLFQENVSSAN